MEYIDIDDDTQNLAIIEGQLKKLADLGLIIIFEISFDFDIPGYPRQVYKIITLENHSVSKHKNFSVNAVVRRELGKFTSKGDLIIALNSFIQDNSKGIIGN